MTQTQFATTMVIAEPIYVPEEIPALQFTGSVFIEREFRALPAHTPVTSSPYAFNNGRTNGYNAVVYCRCGFKGRVKGKETTISQKVNVSSFDGVTTRVVEKVVEDEVYVSVCPDCKEETVLTHYDQTKPHQILFREVNEHRIGHNMLRFVELYDNREEGKDTIALSIGYSNYMAVADPKQPFGYHIIARHPRMRIVYNTRTKMGYWVENGRVINITYRVMMDTKKNKNVKFKLQNFDTLIGLIQKDHAYEENMKKFISLCLESAGVQYYNMDRLGMYSERFSQIFTVCRFPVLQHLNYRSFMVAPLSLKEKKQLMVMTKPKEVLERITGQTTKGILKLCAQFPEALSIVKQMGSYITDPHILLNFLQEVSLESPMHMRDYYLSLEAYVPDADFAILDEILPPIGDHRRKKAEAVFIQRLLKENLVWTREGLARVPENQKNFSYDYFAATLSDSTRMLRMIRASLPEYEVPYNESITQMHDTMALDYNRLRHENKTIPYKEEEEKLEGTFGNLTFRLAVDTHELVDIGARMDICVGSYGDMAVMKEVTIVKAFDSQDRLTLCIELRGSSIVQLKRHKNRFAHPDQLPDIMAWAKANDLNTSGYDIEMIGQTNIESDEAVIAHAREREQQILFELEQEVAAPF